MAFRYLYGAVSFTVAELIFLADLVLAILQIWLKISILN